MSDLIILSLPSIKKHYVIEVEDLSLVGDVEFYGSILSVTNGYIEAATTINKLKEARGEM